MGGVGLLGGSLHSGQAPAWDFRDCQAVASSGAGTEHWVAAFPGQSEAGKRVAILTWGTLASLVFSCLHLRMLSKVYWRLQTEQSPCCSRFGCTTGHTNTHL
jgi:hypothetical protein